MLDTTFCVVGVSGYVVLARLERVPLGLVVVEVAWPFPAALVDCSPPPVVRRSVLASETDVA